MEIINYAVGGFLKYSGSMTGIIGGIIPFIREVGYEEGLAALGLGAFLYVAGDVAQQGNREGLSKSQKSDLEETVQEEVM